MTRSRCPSGFQLERRIRPSCSPSTWLAPLRWEVRFRIVACWNLTLDRETGELIAGTPAHVGVTKLAMSVEVTDANGQILDHRRLVVLRVLPDNLRTIIAPDKHTVALYDWQGPSGRLIEERIAGGEATTLTYTNMGADRRYQLAGASGTISSRDRTRRARLRVVGLRDLPGLT